MVISPFHLSKVGNTACFQQEIMSAKRALWEMANKDRRKEPLSESGNQRI